MRNATKSTHPYKGDRPIFSDWGFNSSSPVSCRNKSVCSLETSPYSMKNDTLGETLEQCQLSRSNLSGLSEKKYLLFKF